MTITINIYLIFSFFYYDEFCSDKNSECLNELPDENKCVEYRLIHEYR